MVDSTTCCTCVRAVVTSRYGAQALADPNLRSGRNSMGSIRSSVATPPLSRYALEVQAQAEMPPPKVEAGLQVTPRAAQPTMSPALNCDQSVTSVQLSGRGV